jgi:hypothetical protein
MKSIRETASKIGMENFVQEQTYLNLINMLKPKEDWATRFVRQHHEMVKLMDNRKKLAKVYPHLAQYIETGTFDGIPLSEVVAQ